MSEARILNVEGLENLREEIVAERDPEQQLITVCAGTGCCASGALDVKEALDEAVKTEGLDVQV